jgi:hypothetical protein
MECSASLRRGDFEYIICNHIVWGDAYSPAMDVFDECSFQMNSWIFQPEPTGVEIRIIYYGDVKWKFLPSRCIDAGPES